MEINLVKIEVSKIPEASGAPVKQGVLTVRSIERKLTKKPAPYFSGVLTDGKDDINFNVWDNSAAFKIIDDMFMEGQPIPGFIIIQSSVNVYNDTKSLIIQSAQIATVNTLLATGVIPVAKRDFGEMQSELSETVSRIKILSVEHYNSDTNIFYHISEVIHGLEEIGLWREFMQLPAGVGIHHAYVYGLLEHTLEVIAFAESMADVYLKTGHKLNKPLLLTGALLHDIAKPIEYTRSPIGLCDGMTVEGGSLGHLYLGAKIVRETFDRVIGNHPEGCIGQKDLALLEHIIASHHGKLEFGAIKAPVCIEAHLVSIADMLSMESTFFAGMEDTKDLWNRHYIMGRSLLERKNV